MIYEKSIPAEAPARFCKDNAPKCRPWILLCPPEASEDDFESFLALTLRPAGSQEAPGAEEDASGDPLLLHVRMFYCCVLMWCLLSLLMHLRNAMLCFVAARGKGAHEQQHI